MWYFWPSDRTRVRDITERPSGQFSEFRAKAVSSRVVRFFNYSPISESPVEAIFVLKFSISWVAFSNIVARTDLDFEFLALTEESKLSFLLTFNVLSKSVSFVTPFHLSFPFFNFNREKFIHSKTTITTIKL